MAPTLTKLASKMWICIPLVDTKMAPYFQSQIDRDLVGNPRTEKGMWCNGKHAIERTFPNIRILISDLTSKTLKNIILLVNVMLHFVLLRYMFKNIKFSYVVFSIIWQKNKFSWQYRLTLKRPLQSSHYIWRSDSEPSISACLVIAENLL